ncbi:MAG TPA: class I SAM-dependent methyltransferase [Acidimicrobiia bacterium]|nr:class I SAM-dependent methyltransferase [Acidimicrobiia bacterium]
MLPLALDLLAPQPDKTYLDVGCGEGRVMAEISARGGRPIGVDVSSELLARAAAYGPVHQAAVPPIPFLADAAVDGVVVVLVLEHIEDEQAVLAEAARVTRPGGVLALIINHPVWTAPRSTPIIDDTGEILWRPGEYFSHGWSDEPAGEGTVRFHHRTMARLLTSAAEAGWHLERMTEEGVTPAQISQAPGLAGQEHIPRLLGVRWRRS